MNDRIIRSTLERGDAPEATQMLSNAPRKQTTCPTPNSRIVNGCQIEITGGSRKGQRGRALLVVGSMWLVDVGGVKVTLHRTCLKRVRDIEVAA